MSAASQKRSEEFLKIAGQFKLGANVGFRGHGASDTRMTLKDGELRDGQRVTYGLGLAFAGH
jgi:hypothetical protein